MTAKRRKKKKYRLKKEVKRKLEIVAVLFALVILIVLLFTALWPKKKYATVGVMLDRALDVEVVQQIIPEGHQNRPGILREIHWIVIHETDNFDASSDAKHHADYLCDNTTDINSWHYTVDDQIIYHHLPDEEVGWHAGDKQTEGGGNMTGIGIEMCVNEGSDFEKTKENAAKLTAVLLKSYDLKLSDVKKHQDFSGKDCPAHLLQEEEWNAFLDLVEQYLNELR